MFSSFSPVGYLYYLQWWPAAGPPTFPLHQLLQLRRSSTPPGSLHQDVQLFNLTSFSRKTHAGPLPLPLDQFLSSQISSLPSLAACSRTSYSSTSPASPATPVFNPSCQPTAGCPTLYLNQPLQSLHHKTIAGLPPLSLIRYRVLRNFLT